MYELIDAELDAVAIYELTDAELDAVCGGAQGPNPGTPHSTANADDNAKQNAGKHLTSAIHADFYI
jgi:hypothetical protein